MTDPFERTEIEKATKSMKNQRSVGEDGLNAEFIKYGPPEIHEGIATLLNTIAETGKYPKEMKLGILTPLPKPGKKQGPPANLRPIILLSVIRKILAICLIRRCWSRLSTEIPIAQAAYQEGRSTTEQVFAVKILAEKAITSSTYNIYLLLLDMSKAFDTVSRKNLLKDLQDVLEPDELHMMSVLINEVKLKVKVGKHTGEEIETNVGIAQGDCLSAVLFIYYLAKSLNTPSNQDDHNYSRAETPIAPNEHHDHNYHRTTLGNYFEIDPKYADDITWASTAIHRISHIKATVASTLQKRNLKVNESKAEEFKISRDSDEKWKSCKLLGNLLDTEKDINRRKILAIAA